MRAIDKIIGGGVALALGALLAVSAAPAVAWAAGTGAFEVDGGTPGKDYSYSDGVLTVNDGADITVSMAGGATTPTSNRIVVAENATATITLAGINIKGSDYDGAQVITAKSAIDLSDGSILTVDLSANTENTLTGGSGYTEGSGAPGIHVPDSASLIIQGEGSLSVSGGTSSTAFGGVGIGGNASTTSAGEACGTVINFASGNVTIAAGNQGSGSDSADDIGGGNGNNQNNGDDGQGIRPDTDGTYTVYGDLTLPCDVTIPAGTTVTIPEGASLTVPEGVKLTNSGTILVQGGTFTNNGTVEGNQPTYPSRVTVSFSQNGKPVTSVPYGSTVTITATMERAGTATNALEVDPGMVGFYLGEDAQSGILVGTDDVEIVNGVYTAAVNVTLDDEKGVTEVGTISITAVFGGYAPEGDEDGDSLAPNTGSAELTVVESYSINYEEETITIAEGYSLYAAETGGNAILTSAGGNNTTSLTGYIQSAARTLYLQAPATGGAEQPDRREITIPARPQAPNTSVSIEYSGEKLSFPPGFTATTLEYALSQSDPNWQDVPSGAALSEMEWDGKAEKSYYFRTGATDTSFASSATTTPITAPARPAKPADPATVEITSNSITIQVVSGQEYRLGSSGEWKTLQGTPGSDGKTVHTYNSLEPGTQYTIETRTPAETTIENKFASFPASVTVTTERADSTLTVEPTDDILTYGDELEITVTPKDQEQAAANALATTENTVELINAADDVLDTATQPDDDGAYTLTYNTQQKGLVIGSNTLTVSFGGNGNMNPSTAEVTVTLNKKQVTATAQEIITKVYDGDTDIMVPLSFADNVLVTGDDISGSVQGIFEDSNVGADKRITLETKPIWVNGSDIAQYYDIILPANVTGDIIRANIDEDITILGVPRFGETLTATYEEEDVSVSYQWKRNGENISGATSASYTLTADDVGQSITVTVSATDGNHTGSVTSDPLTVVKAPGGIVIACESVTYGETVRPSVTGTTNEGAEVTYSYVGTGGTSYGPSATAPENAGTYTVTATVAETATHTSAVSDPVPFSIARPYVPPVAPSGVDWGEVADDIASAKAGGRVVVDMDGETELPGEVLEALAGRDVTLVLEMGDDVAWEIWGGDVPEGTPLSDLNMGVELGTDGIPVDVTNLVTGEAGVVQVALAHDGPFGFGLTLVAPLGEGSDGLHANLYHYDEAAGSLRYECSGVVEGGAARLRLDHASRWAIALDSRSHALPFADAGEGQWYSEAVRWAWLHGVMTGYAGGSGLFGTGDELTRAQAAAVLYNAAGRPEVEAAGLPSDCDPSAWYAAPVAWALSEGIFHGYGDGSTFGPDDPLTREQAACVLHNAAGNPAKAADLSPFSDASEVSGWAEEAVSWAVSEGVINGHDGLLEPARACTRAEAAALMMNLAARG